MSKNRNQNTLLVEIIIAVLFFALCSCVLLETFVAAREYERRSEIETKAIIGMQSITDRLYIADNAEEELAEIGFEADGNMWKLDMGDYVYELNVEYEETSVGIVRSTIIRALRNEKVIAEIPGARYLPGGEAE